MSAEENKALARRAWKIAEDRNIDALDEIVSQSYVYHDPSGEEFRGVEGCKQIYTMYTNAFPDLRVTIEDQVADDEKVVTRWTVGATHQGELFGISPTGKTVTIKGINIFRVRDGKIEEEWEFFDSLGMMQQLGAVPEMAEA